jgi:phenylalanyl-tRNA synthetase beta chain
MKVPLSWLSDYVEIAVPVKELAERLTLAGVEVKGITYLGRPEAELPWDPQAIVVGEVRAVHPHPNADRLVLAEVEHGAPEVETVVTGAPSLLDYRGQRDLHLKVAFAREGAALYDGHAEGKRLIRLKKANIRGVSSRAMVCSEKELGLSDEQVDIIYLPADAPVGMPLVEYMGDAIFDIEVKGPFAHLHSVLGVAREVAVLFDKPLQREALETLEGRGMRLSPTPDFVHLEIADPDLCPRYAAAMIRGVRVGPAPFRMQLRLRRAGMRPINNIVDVTNYVMLELGQPLHAFDYHRLRARPGEALPAIIVRRARPGEQMQTLDGRMQTFDGEMLLITDGGGPVAVAGVMGGLESEVTEATRDVLLESANFHFLNVRRTSRLLGMNTEASMRFGRQVDPELAPKAAARAAWLMAELGGGTVDPVIGDAYPGRRPPQVIEFDPREADRLLGIEIPREAMGRILGALEFGVEPLADGSLRVTVPSHRPDVQRPVDLVEEVSRIWGYDRFPSETLRDELPPLHINTRLEGAERVRDLLVGCGLDEVITYSLTNPEDERMCAGAGFDPAGYLALRNPLSAERTHLRQHLLPSLLRTTRENLRFLERVAIFELGSVYLPQPGEALPAEPRRLGMVMTGPREARSWLAGQDRTPLGFFDLKGVVEALLEGLHLPAEFEPGEHPALHPGRCAQVQVGDQVVGAFGELHPQARDAFGLPAQPVCALEFDLDALLAGWGAPRTVTPISVHPPVYEDLAFIVREELPAAAVARLIAQTGGPLVRAVALFDVYRGEQIGAGHKSLAYRLTYQADDRTLNDKDVAAVRAKIARRLERELGASLRG